MKRFSRIFVSLMLAIVMILSVGMLAACSEEQANNGGNDTPTTSDNQGGGGNSTEPEPEPYVYKEEDRSEYSVMNAANAYLDASIYDLITTGASEDGILSYLNGYRFGDVYDIAVSAMMSNMAEGSDLPTESITALQFTRGTDGNWYNFYKSPVHPILNKFLNFELNGKGDLGLTLAELETYTDTSLVYLVKWSMTNSTTGGNETINRFVEQMIDGMVGQIGENAISATLNAKVSDLAMCFEGKTEGFLNIYGKMTVAGFVGTEAVPAPYAGWTIEQLYAVYSGDEERFVDTFGEYTVAELTAFLGYTVPEEFEAFYAQYANMTVAEYYAMAKQAAAMMAVAMYGSEEEVYEAFGGEEYVLATFLARFFEVEEDATPSILYDYTVADFIMACRAEDAALEEMGYEEYSMMMLEKAWGEVKDYTLGEICAMFEVELPEEYGEYAELSLEQIYEMILAAVNSGAEVEPVTIEPAPKGVRGGDEGGAAEEEETMTYDDLVKILCDIVLLEKVNYVYDDVEGMWVENDKVTLYAIDVFDWFGELYYRLSQSQAEGCDIDAAYEAWCEFLEYNDNNICFWLTVLDEQSGYGPVPKSAPVLKDDGEGYEAGDYYDDGYYGDDDYGYQENNAFFALIDYLMRMSNYDRYSMFKTLIDRAYGFYGMACELSVRDLIYNFTNGYVSYEETGNEPVDAFGMLVMQYYEEYTLPDLIANYQEVATTLLAAFCDISLYDLYNTAELPEGFELPECVANFLEVYGEYPFGSFAEMNEEDTDAFVAAILELYDGLSDIAAEEIELGYDFGNEAVNKFVKKMMLYNASEVTDVHVIMEALKSVTLKDVLMAGMKVYYDVYSYVQEHMHNEHKDVESPDGKTFCYGGYGGYGEFDTKQMEDFYNNYVVTRTETYFSFYGECVTYCMGEGKYMYGTYKIDGYTLSMLFTSYSDGQETGETYNVVNVQFYGDYFELITEVGDDYNLYIAYAYYNQGEPVYEEGYIG